MSGRLLGIIHSYNVQINCRALGYYNNRLKSYLDWGIFRKMKVICFTGFGDTTASRSHDPYHGFQYETN